MARNPRRQDAALDALYARLPSIDCQGLCHDSCGPIEMSIRERDRIERQAGKPVTCGTGASCSMLTADRRCGAYDVRPMVCRLWGVVESLPCPYGCRPEGGLLNDADGYRLMAEALRAGGSPEAVTVARRLEDGLRALEAEPEEFIQAQARLAARMVTPRPSLSGRAAALPRTLLEHPTKEDT